METFELLRTNLASPITLAFALGVVSRSYWRRNYFPHYVVIAYLTNVGVVRGECNV